MRTFNPKFERIVYDLFAGEIYVTKDQSIMMSTLLGSCVAVCMRDPVAGVFGMNHYMLPWRNEVSTQIKIWDGRYGFFAMDHMIQKMVQLGADPQRLEAKVYGGGRMMERSSSNVADDNVRFAKSYLEMHRIPILYEHVGGINGRRIFFFPDSFQVQVRVIDKTEIKETDELNKNVGTEYRRRT